MSTGTAYPFLLMTARLGDVRRRRPCRRGTGTGTINPDLIEKSKRQEWQGREGRDWRKGNTGAGGHPYYVGLHSSELKSRLDVCTPF